MSSRISPCHYLTAFISNANVNEPKTSRLINPAQRLCDSENAQQLELAYQQNTIQDSKNPSFVQPSPVPKVVESSNAPPQSPSESPKSSITVVELDTTTSQPPSSIESIP